MDYEHHEIEGISNLESVSLEQLEEALRSCDEKIKAMNRDKHALLMSIHNKENNFSALLDSMVNKFYRRKNGPSKHRRIIRRVGETRLESIVVYGDCIRKEIEGFIDEEDINRRMEEETEKNYYNAYNEVSLNMRNSNGKFKPIEGMAITNTIL